MFTDFLNIIFEDNKNKEAIIYKEKIYYYRDIINLKKKWKTRIKDEGIPIGAVIVLEADFSPDATALLLALTDHCCIIVPLAIHNQEFIKISQSEYSIIISENNSLIKKIRKKSENELYKKLREENHPGLVLFSSGSSGKSKGAVHDLTFLLEKFTQKRFCRRTISFLLFDHIGGINTLLYTLSNAGCLITVQERSPDIVLELVEKYQAELLPVSPTFLNLVLISEAYKRYRLDSLKIITYGTEPMPESTLLRFNDLFPGMVLLQTYGLSETGILRSKSKNSGSLWVKIGGEGIQTRVVDGILEIKTKSAMLGYLNANSPFTADGWFITGDMVETDGEYIKILGRQSDIINVGGEKVYPAEVESVIQDMENVESVVVYGEKNLITGNIVCVRVKLIKEEDSTLFGKRLKKYCSERLKAYKVPIRIKIVNHNQYNERFKKVK